MLLFDQNWYILLVFYTALVIVLSIGIRWLLVKVQKSSLHLDSLVSRFLFPVHALLFSVPIFFIAQHAGLPDSMADVVSFVAKLALTYGAAMIGVRLIGLVTSIYSRRFKTNIANDIRARRLNTQMQFLEQVANIFVVFIALAFFASSFEALRSFGGSLLASAALTSAIIGISAQKSLGNLIAGLQIAFTQPIRLGDVVVVENEWGIVEEITMTYVVVRIWDLRRLVLPITYFVEKPFQNWTRTSAQLLGNVMVFLDYTVPMDALRKEVTRILKHEPLWDGLTNVVQVVDATERTMQIRILMSAANSPNAFDLRCAVREKVILFLQKNYPTSLPQNRVSGELQVPSLNTAPSLNS